MTSLHRRRPEIAIGAGCALAVLFAWPAAPAGAKTTHRRSAGAPKTAAASADAGADAAPSKADLSDASPGAAVLSKDAAATSPAGESAAALQVDDAGMETAKTKARRGKRAAATSDPDAAKDEEEDTEDDRENGLGAEVALDSRYVWRGIAFSQGPVVQPSAWASLYGFTFEMWSAVMLNDEPEHDRLSALEPSLTFAWTLNRLKVEPGVILFWTRGEPGPESTVEATLEASYPIGPLRLVSGTYVDVQAHAGAYFGTLGASYQRSLDDWTVKALLDVGWATSDFNDAYFGVDAAAFNLVQATLSARYDLTDLFYFSLHAEASTLLSPLLRNSVEEPTLGSGGASFGIDY